MQERRINPKFMEATFHGMPKTKKCYTTDWHQTTLSLGMRRLPAMEEDMSTKTIAG